MDPNPVISFDNTENAFAYKTDEELKRAMFLFKTMSYQGLVKLGTRITPWAIRANLREAKPSKRPRALPKNWVSMGCR